MNTEELIEYINIKLPTNGNRLISAEDLRDVLIEMLSSIGDFKYTNRTPSYYQVGGVPAGTVFDQMPLKELLDFIFYGRDNRKGTEIVFKVKTTKKNEKVPIILLRSEERASSAVVNYGDGKEESIVVEKYSGDMKWVDEDGNVHYVDSGNTIYHEYSEAGEYEVTIKALADVYYIRLCESIIQMQNGEVLPKVTPNVVELIKLKSDSVTNLDFSFGGLINCKVNSEFVISCPEVTSISSGFFDFGSAISEGVVFPANMLSELKKVTCLNRTFMRSGIKKILEGFFDGLPLLYSVFECFKNSSLGNGYYNGTDPVEYMRQAIDGSNDFIPVSLFWKNPNLLDISHCFNFIGGGWFGNCTSGYLAYHVIRRELFWNGKSLGNKHGTIKNALYAFAKNNRIILEPNILKHSPDMEHIGGIFTQTNQTSHAVGWGGIVPVAASETEIYEFSESGGEYFAKPVPGKGLTYDLNVIFPDVYPKILTITGAFSTAAVGSNFGFQHAIDYTPNGVPAKKNIGLEANKFLSKFPNAKEGSVSSYIATLLGQSGGTEEEKKDGRNGAFYMLDQDNRIIDKEKAPKLLFNNAIPY